MPSVKIDVSSITAAEAALRMANLVKRNDGFHM